MALAAGEPVVPESEAKALRARGSRASNSDGSADASNARWRTDDEVANRVRKQPVATLRALDRVMGVQRRSASSRARMASLRWSAIDRCDRGATRVATAQTQGLGKGSSSLPRRLARVSVPYRCWAVVLGRRRDQVAQRDHSIMGDAACERISIDLADRWSVVFRRRKLLPISERRM